jgi:nucleotide-binding universal stress UspA family protein
MNTIVLATDGSPSAIAATAEAIDLAQDLDARLVAVAVEHVPAYGYYGYGDVSSALLAGEHEHVQRVLAEIAHQCEDAGVHCETVAATGPVVEEICRVARERDATFVVVGAHGWGAFRRAVFGSISTAVLHEAPCPVLVVRALGAAEEHDLGHVHADAAAV